MRIAWFSPLPPSRSGIAAYSAEVVPRLRARHGIDLFVDRTPEPAEIDVWNAHDFVWRRRRTPYDLTVYQLGNASCHDYMWAYLFRYPGLVVLHDAQLHQARALFLTSRWKPRTEDYLAEFVANHPDAPPDIGHIIAAGCGGALYPHWPHVKLVVETARLTAVHNKRLAEDLQVRYPKAAIDWMEMGVADPALTAEHDDGRAPADRPDAHVVRARHGIPGDAIVIAAFGGITPEKRIGTLIDAVAALAGTHPRMHVLLVGGSTDHYDVAADVERHNLRGRVHVAGFVPDAELPDYLAASDVCACLRWPTNRETSASWLRCLAAGKPTIISDLTHLADVPTLDPRNWRLLDASGADGDRPAEALHAPREPVAVSIDVLDEAHSLKLAVDRLASDRRLRSRIGVAARQWWEAHHQLDAMADAYERLLARAAASEPPIVDLPAHLRDDGTAKGKALVEPFGLQGLGLDG